MSKAPDYEKEVVERICAIVDSADFESNFKITLSDVDSNHEVLKVIDRVTSKLCFSVTVQHVLTLPLGNVYKGALFYVMLGNGSNLPKSSNELSISYNDHSLCDNERFPASERYTKLLRAYEKLVAIRKKHIEAKDKLQTTAAENKLNDEKTHCLGFLNSLIQKSQTPGAPGSTCVCELRNGKFICLAENDDDCPVPQALQAEKDLYDAGYGAAGATVDPSKYDCRMCDAYLNYMAKNRQK